MTNTNTTTKVIDWSGFVIPYIKGLLDNEYTFRPTIRGVFYRAGSDEVIPLTTPAYKGLVKALSTARKNGTIAMDAFGDNSRHIIDLDEQYQEPSQIIDDHLKELRYLPETYYDTIPRWHGQPHYVEVFIEKDAVVGALYEILKDRQVRIVPNRGWSSITYEYNNIQRLLANQREGKIVHVLYLGDYDPTGLRMSDNLRRKFRGYGIHFERVALTRSQIVEFGLDYLKNPDAEVLRKLQRDPNANAFMRENGSLFQIEADSLPSSSLEARSPQKSPSVISSFSDSINASLIYSTT